MSSYRIYCVSHRRPSNVQRVAAAFPGEDITFVVPSGQAEDYRKAGASRVLEVNAKDGMKPLCAQRNAALEDAFSQDKVCIQTDDDVKALGRYEDGKLVPSSFPEYVQEWARAFRATGAMLAGCAPTPNPFYSNGKVKTAHFVMAQLFAAAPCDLRFDERLAVREDYDFTARHITAFGAVARCDALLPTYEHWDNAGGCQDYRSEQLDAEVNAVLLARWPGLLHPHPRRAGELVLRAPRKGRAA